MLMSVVDAKKMVGSSPCASCKLLRRRCAKECIFAPYFPPDDPQRFAVVHKVFGASNVSKMLQEIGVDERADAVSSLVFEAKARMRDPVYGCVGEIAYLQNQVSELQMQLNLAQTQLLTFQMQDHPSTACIQNQKQQQIDGSSITPPTNSFCNNNMHDYLRYAACTGYLIKDQNPLKTEFL